MSTYVRRSLFLSGAVLALGCLSLPAYAGIGNAFARPGLDNSIYEEGNQSNGAGEYLFAGNTLGFDARRALLQFDLSQWTLPQDAMITGAGVTMYCDRSPAGDDTPHEFSLHRVTAAWGAAGSNAGDPGGLGAPAEPGDATWLERFFGQGQPWDSAGGDYDPTPSATTVVGPCSEANVVNVVFLSDGLADDVQGWVDDPASNFGWILIGDETQSKTARRFGSVDNDLITFSPVLDAVYDFEVMVPATSPLGLAALLVIMVAAFAIGLHRFRRAT
jgi:hypothetical protein